MHHTPNAGHHCGNRQGCLKGTRKGVLKDIGDWFASDQGQRVFWLTLGTKAQIPTGYMVKTLRAQSTFDSNVPSD